VVVVVGASVVDVVAAVEVLDVMGALVVVVVDGSDRATGPDVDEVGSVVTAGVACEVEEHPAISIASAVIDHGART
jgi:hypothetical protein